MEIDINGNFIQHQLYEPPVKTGYEAWRISYQSSEQAARAAFNEVSALTAERDELRQRVAVLEKEAKQLRDLQYELMRSGALVAIEKCKNATGQRRVIDMYVSANQIAEDLLNAMDSGA